MKKEIISRIFKGCNIKYTKSEMSGGGMFKYYQIKKENVYVFTYSNRKSVDIVDFGDGVLPKQIRTKSFKIEKYESEISQEQYINDLKEWKEIIDFKTATEMEVFDSKNKSIYNDNKRNRKNTPF